MVGATGVEPVTFSMSRKRSNQAELSARCFLALLIYFSVNCQLKRVVMDGSRTLYPQEIQLLVKTTIRKGRRGFVYLHSNVSFTTTIPTHAF